MNRRPNYLALGMLVAALAACLGWWLTDNGEGLDVDDPDGATREPTTSAHSGELDDPGSIVPPGGERRSPNDESEIRAERRREADRLRAAIREAAAQRAAAQSSGADPQAPRGDAGATASIEAEYIRDAVRAVQPLLAECYELALAAARDAGEEPPQGRLVMRFEIMAEPEVGGVVDESEVLEVSDVRHPTLDECFAETLYTLELPAPEGGGRITVRHPFVLAPDGDPSEAETNAVDTP